MNRIVLVILMALSVGVLGGCHGKATPVLGDFDFGISGNVGGDVTPPAPKDCLDQDGDGTCDDAKKDCADEDANGTCDDQEKDAVKCADADGDALCDDKDSDIDGDGIANALDVWPTEASSLIPRDGIFVRKGKDAQDKNFSEQVEILQKWDTTDPAAPVPVAARYLMRVTEAPFAGVTWLQEYDLESQAIGIDPAGTWSISWHLKKHVHKSDGAQPDEDTFFNVTATAGIIKDGSAIKAISVHEARQEADAQWNDKPGVPKEEKDLVIGYAPSADGAAETSYDKLVCAESLLASLLTSVDCQVSDAVKSSLKVTRDAEGRPQTGELTIEQPQGAKVHSLAYTTKLSGTTLLVRGGIGNSLDGAGKEFHGTKVLWVEAKGTEAAAMAKILTDVTLLLMREQNSLWLNSALIR